MSNNDESQSTEGARSGGHAEAAQEDLLKFLESGNLPAIFSDDPAFVAQLLSPNGGCTFANIVADHDAYRAARRALCANVLRFVVAVIEDEDKRGQFPTSSPETDTAAIDALKAAVGYVEGIDPVDSAHPVEIAQVAQDYQHSHPIDQERTWNLLQAAHERAKAITSEESERENARLIAAHAADDFANDAALVARDEPEWIADADNGHVMKATRQIYRLTEEEGSAIETAARALLLLPRIPYRDRSTTEASAETDPESIQDRATAAEGDSGDTLPAMTNAEAEALAVPLKESLIERVAALLRELDAMIYTPGAPSFIADLVSNEFGDRAPDLQPGLGKCREVVGIFGSVLFGQDVIEGGGSHWCDTLYELFRVALVTLTIEQESNEGQNLRPGHSLQFLIEAAVVAALRLRTAQEGGAE